MSGYISCHVGGRISSDWKELAEFAGCDFSHADLASNAWVNTGEIPNNGIDDDGNGFVDGAVLVPFFVLSCSVHCIMPCNGPGMNPP